MNDRYQWICDRYEELNAAISQPETIADQAKYQAYLRELSRLEPMVNAWSRYQRMAGEIDQARELASDPDLGDMAQAELVSLLEEQAALETQLRIMLLPPDPDDDRSAIVEIRGGTGGDEACLFAAMLLRMYTHYAERHGLRLEPVSVSWTELGGVKEAVVSVTGAGAFAHMKYESGVHCVKRVPPTESGGRLHTSTCTVAVLPEAEDVEVTIDPNDLRIDVYRSTGAGGQHVNTTDSAVRITHIPTGMVVTSQDERSQIQNRAKAMQVLKARLLERFRAEKDAAYAENRRIQIGTGDRSERIRTHHFMKQRVTDHRIGLTLFRVEDIIDGDLDEFVQALRTEEQTQRLKQFGAGG